MLLRSMQNTRRCDAKAENDALLRDDVAVVVVVYIKQSVDQFGKPPPPPAWIMQPPRLANLPAEQVVYPQREADHYAKTTGRNPEYVNEQCR